MTPDLLELEPEVVAFARAFADAAEHRHAAVLHGDVVDQLHDDDGLADAGAAEQADLAALQIRLEQVDDLDAGLEHLAARWTALRASARADESASAPSIAPGGREVDRLAEHVQHAAERLRTDGHRDRRAGVDRRHAARHAVGRLHRDGAHAVLAEMLLDLGDDVDLLDAGPPSETMRTRVVDRRQMPARELDVDAPGR